MKKINIELKSNPYEIYYGSGIFKDLNKLIKNKNLPSNVFAVIDSGFYSKWKSTIEKNLSGKFSKYDFIKITPNEKDKSLKTLEKILKKLTTNNYSRDTLIISIGGGIVGDIAGFAASVFSRGVKYIQVPTTLLAAVDSSIGGKTGVNLEHTKNIVGSIYQPEFVLIDTNFLKTLPREEILCGAGEIIKYAYLTDEKFYTYVLKNIEQVFALNKKVIEKVIFECVNFKGSVVENDEKEVGLRKVLNLGHTFAHGIEVEQNHKIKHGKAVVVGLASALYLSNKVGLLKDEKLKRYSLLINKFKSEIKINSYNKHKIYGIMQRDKKNRNNKIKFVLLKKTGEVILDCEAERNLVLESIEYGLNLFAK
ncbi:MAG: 3-dehydroquinate synthase [Bacteroidetes bacterium]|nr:3-dehydroquinate synthase [Bacteroidota bacterium]